MEEKKYTSAARMAADLLDDPTVEKGIEEHLARRQMMNCLVAERAKANLTLTEVAKRMGVSVSKVSRLEGLEDNAISLGDLKAYSKAIHMKMSLLFANDKVPVADRIKHYVFRIEDMLNHLTALAQSCVDDRTIVDGITRFRAEVLYNFLVKFKETGENLPVFSTEESSNEVAHDEIARQDVPNRMTSEHREAVV